MPKKTPETEPPKASADGDVVTNRTPTPAEPRTAAEIRDDLGAPVTETAPPNPALALLGFMVQNAEQIYLPDFSTLAQPKHVGKACQFVIKKFDALKREHGGASESDGSAN